MQRIVKKTTLTIAVAVMAAFWATSAFAHTFWTTAEPAKPGEKPIIINGYSDFFPKAEPIEEKRLAFILPPEFIAPDGHKIPLEPGSANYLYVSSEPVKKGTYLVTGEYIPTFWTQTKEDGWAIKPKNEVTGTIVDSYRTAIYAKGIYNVDGAADTELITKPVGQKIELIPQSNPATLKVGEKFRMQLLYDGKPLANEPVYGLVEGYGGDLHNIKAFQNTTDKNGFVDFIPWKTGAWQMEVRYGIVPADTSKHNIDYWNAKLNFLVK
ncbi:MAG: DUF4198 domain-containing protein [Deltaproteobacteria bacterium]|jgi:uncharacterized GH25 family protein|nr:DUF4198 domain-containing protein [Deltaproteobacteria bacterium]